MEPTLEQRLSLLPPRSAAPFRQLLRNGQLTDEVVLSVLDAGELAGDRVKLIGFAAGFLHLRAQGVPVHDVIRMAKAQGRRVNLAWSPQRWKAEHDRLSRAEALRRMVEHNTHYDVSRYAAHLPPQFPGYLIRSSRRLGMEGLRQRHCVASYHDRLHSGASAIASVLLDNTRWTVELKLTGDADRPLHIVQIKTRHNGLPSAAVSEAIHRLLAITRPDAPTTESDGLCLYMQTLQRLLPILREHSIRSVGVSFDGCGDSGSIETVMSYPSETQATFDGLTVEYLETQRLFDDGHWRSRVAPVRGTLRQAVEALTYDYLEETGVDWYNNDGGFGELTIEVEEGTVSLQINVRYTETQVEYSAVHDIATHEEL
jgi:hypothetical protein